MSDEVITGGDNNQTEKFWEELYQKREQVWSGHANAALVNVIGSLPAGRALDLGCGEGGDAIWLAQHGWHVTAVDVSATALKRALAQATKLGLEALIDFQQHDLTSTFPAGTFDLVSAQFLQSPLEFPRDSILQKATQAVAPGGLLLVVTHASVPSWGGNSHSHPRFPTLEEEFALLDLVPEHWHVERMDIPERQITGPDGQPATVSDNVIAVRRLVRQDHW